MSPKRKHKRDLAKSLWSAGIQAFPDKIGIEHLRYLKGHSHRRNRFDDLIKATFKLSPSAPGAKSAHLLAFHMVLPDKVPAALAAVPFSMGDGVFIDYVWNKDAPTERRQLCVLSVNAFANTTVDSEADWYAFLTWVRTIPAYAALSGEALVAELTFDMLAWGVSNIPYVLWAHAIGLRPLQPVPKSTLARIASGQALDYKIEEETIAREIRIADMLDAMNSRLYSGSESPSQSDIRLIDDAKNVIKTRADESPAETTDRWVSGLLGFHPRLEAAEFSCALVLNWMTDLAESGTVAKWDLRRGTKRRYMVNGASPFHYMTHRQGSHPSTWTSEQVNAMCLELMEDSSIRDKVGLGGAISSFFSFLHLHFNCPLPRQGIHSLIPETVPRAQFVTGGEVKTAIAWAASAGDSDMQLMAIVRTALAMGWAAPFRLQELLNLEMRNVAECSDGSYEVEVLPKGWHAPLKTPAAMRRVYIDKGWAAELLRDFLNLRMGQGATGKSLLFASENEEDTVYRKYAVQALLLRLLKCATGDPEMTFHALRHSWASVRVADVLASSSIANFNRLSHIAAEMGHVSAVSTLHFYSHFSEFSLNCHLSDAIREILQMKDGTSEIHFGEKSNTTLQRWQRKFPWPTEQCMWQEFEVRSRNVEVKSVCAEFPLAEPSRPTFTTYFVHPFHPVKVMRVLNSLCSFPHKEREVAYWNHLSESDVSLISQSAIEMALEWLEHFKKRRQQIAGISSVNGALAALHIDLHAATRTKYSDFRCALSVPLTIPADFNSAWMHTRTVVRLPAPKIYFFLHPTTHVQPLLELLQSAGFDSTDLIVRVPFKLGADQSHDVTVSDVAFTFQGVWGEAPDFRPVAFHPARKKPYLTFPGIHVPAGMDSPVHAEAGGLDALLFCCAVFARSMEKKNVVA